jgi:uncharacterized membrane protein YkvI
MTQATRFQRYLLPGFAFNAFVVGGGYATGRELVEFFLPAGPWGGLVAMVFATAIWSAICAVTFLFARATGSEDYRRFFRHLLGPAWIAFEGTYLLLLVLVLAVFGAATGAMGTALFGWPTIAGTLALVAAIAAFAALGTDSVEWLFKYVTFFLYAVYAVFVCWTLAQFADRIQENFAAASGTEGWFPAGLTYASYNVIGAVVILPVLRHLQSGRDAAIAGILAGPIAMVPAFFFFVCMIGWYPAISAEVLPSEFMLRQLGLPLLYGAFQLMIFLAILDTGVGVVHAFNERVSNVVVERRGRGIGAAARLGIAAALLVGSVFVADRFGLVALIARGYRASAWIVLAVFILPLLTVGVWRLLMRRAEAPTA